MDSTIFQLFSIGEILARLGQTLQTGSLHVFTQRESANIFFKDGIVVAAAKGLVEGEEVVKNVLEWKDPRMVWQLNEAPPTQLKSQAINIISYLQLQKSEPVSKAVPPASTPAPAVAVTVPAPASRPVVFVAEPASPPAKAILTVVAPTLAPVAQGAKLTEIGPVTSDAPLRATSPIQLTATKTISTSAQARSAQEEALVQKHRLVLVSAEDPTQRIKITRANCLIGRNPACDITLDHGSVSRQHCLLHLTDRGLHLKDLDTTNGTKVNGIALTEGYVGPGDKVTIGHLVYLLQKETLPSS